MPGKRHAARHGLQLVLVRHSAASGVGSELGTAVSLVSAAARGRYRRDRPGPPGPSAAGRQRCRSPGRQQLHHIDAMWAKALQLIDEASSDVRVRGCRLGRRFAVHVIVTELQREEAVRSLSNPR
jgi:hypothetical protein